MCASTVQGGRVIKDSLSFPAQPQPVLRPWRELAVLSFILMELSWVALYFQILMPAGRAVSYERILVVLAIILLVSYFITRASDYLNLALRARQGLLAGLFVVNALFGLRALISSYRFSGFNLQEFFDRPASTLADIANLVPAEFFVLLVVFWAWWRGISLVSKQVGPVNVIAGFRIGIGGLFVYGLALPLIGATPVWLAIPVFLFSSLLAMSAARIAVLVHLRGGQRIPFSRNRLAGIVSAVLVAALLSSLAAGAMRGSAFELVTQVFSWTLYLIAILLGPLLLLFMRAIFLVGEWLNFANALSSVLSFFQSLQASIQKWVEAIEKILGGFQVPGLQSLLQVLYVLRFALFWGAILLGVLLVLLPLQRRIWKKEGEEDQGAEAIQGGGDLADLVRSVLRRSFSRMTRGFENVLRKRRTGQLLAAARIRRIYARLLNLSARLDSPRPAACTPLEFLPRLESLFPGMRPDLVTITHAYLRVRYGELSETVQEVKAVEEAWRRIAREGKARLSARKRKA